MTLAYLIRANLASTTGLPRDVVVNDFVVHFDSGGPSGSDFTAAEASIAGFWTGVNDGVATLGSYMGSSIDRSLNKCSCQTFEIPDAPGALGAAVHSTAWTMPAQNLSGIDLPNEVAATLSFHSDLTGVPEHGSGGTRPAARRKGRVFIGPLITGSMAYGHGSGTPQRIDSGFRTKLLDCGNAIHDALIAVGWHWRVWSRVDWATHDVVGGWVDDDFDTQRRRQLDTIVRSSMTW